MISGVAVKAPIPTDWALWDGDRKTMYEIREWAAPADKDRIWFDMISPAVAAGEFGDEEYTAVVFDYLHSRWIPLRTGDRVMRGGDGECYPCKASVFEKTYNVTEVKKS